VPCTIAAAAKSVGVPWCENCCIWGHPSGRCTNATRCPICGGPHSRNEHRQCCGLCKGDKKAKPHPIPPTPRDQECPHKFKCIACRRDNCGVDSRKCQFWNHRFDRDWIVAQYAKVRAFQERGRQSLNRSIPNV
jgi:hypothetical protein